jgi:hypothetical protein
MTRLTGRLIVVAALTLASVAWPGTAHAHGDDEATEGYVLVQQALAHLAHDTSAEGIDLAMEKVNDALETDDQEGVDVAELQRGMDALQAGDVGRARAMLEHSIAAALAGRPLATGYETGTGLVPWELAGRGALGIGDGLLLGLSVALAAVGAWLSVRFRPHDSVGALRLLLGSKPAAGVLSESSAGARSVRRRP